jgi:hypothetical protein
MTEPTPIASYRDAREAHNLCAALGKCCEGHTIGIVSGAVAGLISMLPPEIQAQLGASIAQRVVAMNLVDNVQLPPETETMIEKIVKGIT